ncbi:7861_t:CDS:2, partial [Gigaspora margarita]
MGSCNIGHVGVVTHCEQHVGSLIVHIKDAVDKQFTMLLTNNLLL